MARPLLQSALVLLTLAAGPAAALAQSHIPAEGSMGRRVAGLERQQPNIAESHTPAEGSNERKTILDAARAPVETELGRRVVFLVKTFRVDGEWAFLEARMAEPGNGADISYAGTPYEDAARRGHKSNNYVALLRSTPKGWIVEDHVIGPTDVAWEDWSETHGAPKDIFPDAGE